MIFFFLVSLLYCVTSSGLKISPSLFEEFKAKYEKSYSSAKEEQYRLKIFSSNMAKAEEMNRANPLARFGVNKFADLTEDEFKFTHANGKKFYEAAQASNFLSNYLTTYSSTEEVTTSCSSIDWRKKGAVTNVKDQAGCGSCWAFSATGAIEGQWFTAGHPLVSLSEQELVSCDTNDDDCGGGKMDLAFKWLVDKRRGQIVTETSMPYVSSKGNVPKCPANLSNLTVGAVIKGFLFLPHDELQMATFVCKNGPISIAVDSLSWQSYKNGILTNCISISVDHGVLIVGFDKNNNPPYWIIKNSWGSDWGEGGYIRVAYGSNQCLLKNYVLAPIINNTTVSTFKVKTVAKHTKYIEPSYTLVQKIFIVPDCYGDYNTQTFPLNTCVDMGYGGSKIAQCTNTSVKVLYYTDSVNCSGTVIKEDVPFNKCVRDESMAFAENQCVLN